MCAPSCPAEPGMRSVGASAQAYTARGSSVSISRIAGSAALECAYCRTEHNSPHLHEEWQYDDEDSAEAHGAAPDARRDVCLFGPGCRSRWPLEDRVHSTVDHRGHNYARFCDAALWVVCRGNCAPSRLLSSPCRSIPRLGIPSAS